MNWDGPSVLETATMDTPGAEPFSVKFTKTTEFEQLLVSVKIALMEQSNATAYIRLLGNDGFIQLSMSQQGLAIEHELGAASTKPVSARIEATFQPTPREFYALSVLLEKGDAQAQINGGKIGAAMPFGANLNEIQFSGRYCQIKDTRVTDLKARAGSLLYAPLPIV
jgi:hypothetical protein